MNRSIRSFLGITAASAALLPLVAGAQTTPLLGTPDQVREVFVEAGFQVDAPHTWWTNGSTTFLVHDATGATDPTGRVVMVLVYPDLDTARTERQRAGVAGEGYGTDDLGPRLVPGYGPSRWHANVAMVESSQVEINRLYQAQLDADLGTTVTVGPSQPAPAMQPLGAPTAGVDAEFVTALEHGLTTVNL